jgi:hypothetical protein
MRVIEKDHIVSDHKVGTFLAYEDVEAELAEPQLRDRVLPAPFFYEKRLFFMLHKRHEPGERFWPKGGYEVRDEGGAIRCFDLDQVILHPAVIKHKRTLEKMARRAEKMAKRRERQLKQGNKPQKEKVPGARRGRPALDPAEKAAREADRISRGVRSGGKRGRPPGKTPSTPKVKVKSSTGKRGRPALSPEALAQKAALKLAITTRSGGKRGRPKRAM